MTKPWFEVPPPLCEYGHAKTVIIEAPYEGTVSFGKGASQGPQAIREASIYVEFYDPILDTEVHKQGIHSLPQLTMPEDPWKAALAVKSAVVRELETGRFPVVVGGEHSLTVGAISAAIERYPSLSVLHLDAHADLRDEYEGSKFSHACVMKRAHDLGADFVQVGIRSMSGRERQWLMENNRDVVSSRSIIKGHDWIDRALEKLGDPVYVTLDLDVLDPSEMPATGTPEPGGISYHHLIDLFLAIKGSGKRVVGMDMMEFAPVPGLIHPQYLAARLLYTMVGAFAGP